ncbi:MAG TPA: PepSY-like domain-containing protein [Pyrinomonadaceae bacterium]|nr:PepSY-like domain-containing protein [Pyrinomonadaceae bacterium]
MKLTYALSRFALVTFAISLVTLSAVAQEKKITAKQVPAAVIAAFKSSYPNATIRGYAEEKEDGKTFYEVESVEGTTHRDVLYNADGTVAEIEESIAAADLPADAQQAIRQKYPRAVIMLAEKTTAGDTVGYEVSLRNGRKRIAMEFDSSGKLKTKGK